jgi:endonuclease YncB( thermonuclease family)
MFGWRRRSEGFEWQEYVRTTVLVRRADRQRKVDDVRMAALAKAKDTRDRGVAAGRAAADTASQSAIAALKSAARSILRLARAWTRQAWSLAHAGGVAVGDRLPDMPRPQWSQNWSPSWLQKWSLAVPSALRASAVRRLLPDVGFRLPFNSRIAGGSVLAVALVVFGGPMLRSSLPITTAQLIPTVAAPASETVLSGRATAINGDLVRVAGQLVKLAGVEAPEAKQPCLKSNGRRWNCGASARTALEKIIRGKTVTCTPSGQDGDGQSLATCRANDADIAETLVRGGHVFAASGFFASYTAAEVSARDAKAGLWQGDSVRPKEWREIVWEEAKRAAPEGCPIKGHVRASDRIYAMPWADGYSGAKVRTVKGDRWFCSEDEARAAGFKRSSRS